MESNHLAQGHLVYSQGEIPVSCSDAVLFSSFPTTLEVSRVKKHFPESTEGRLVSLAAFLIPLWVIRSAAFSLPLDSGCG